MGNYCSICACKGSKWRNILPGIRVRRPFCTYGVTLVPSVFRFLTKWRLVGTFLRITRNMVNKKSVFCGFTALCHVGCGYLAKWRRNRVSSNWRKYCDFWKSWITQNWLHNMYRQHWLKRWPLWPRSCVPNFKSQFQILTELRRPISSYGGSS